MKAQSKETQQNLTPELVLLMLKEGNQRFAKNLKANRNLQQQVLETSEGQFPIATILSCMDSRTSAELIFDKGLGDIFSIRIAGNVLNDDILGSMEFGAKVVGTKLILVLGHTKCGAIVGACDGVKMGNLTQLLEKMQAAIDAEKETVDNRTGSNQSFVDNVTVNNIHLVMEQIRAQSPIIKELEAIGNVQIAGGLYDVKSGKVTFY
jgi:carbonic anhydrase